MYWNDDNETDAVTPSHDKIDFVFQLIGQTLPQNYLGGFADVLHNQTSFWGENECVSFFVHIAGEEGNGWYRDSHPDAVIHLSRRNMLVIRAPIHLSLMVINMAGMNLDISQHNVQLKHKHNKEIRSSPTLYSRYVVCDDQSESDFIESVTAQLAALKVRCKKLLCGKTRRFIVNGKQLVTCSLMLEGLSKEDSIVIQSSGIGGHQKTGCGVFIPHKSAI